MVFIGGWVNNFNVCPCAENVRDATDCYTCLDCKEYSIFIFILNKVILL